MYRSQVNILDEKKKKEHTKKPKITKLYIENMLARIKNMENVIVYANSLYKNLEDSRLSLRGIKKISYTGFSVVYRFFRLL